MKRKITPFDFVIYLFSITIIILMLMKATFNVAEIKFNDYKTIAIIISITFTYCFLVDRFKYSLFALPLIFLVPKPLYIIKYFKSIIAQWGDFYGSFTMNQYIPDNFGGYFANLMFITAAILSIVFYIIVVVRKRAMIIIAAGSIMFAVYYFINEINVFSQCSTFLITAIFLYAYCNFNHKRDIWRRNDSNIKNSYFIKWLISALLIVIATRFITTAFSYEIKPASFEWYEKYVVERFEEIGNREDRTLSAGSYKMKFNFTRTGFQQNPQRLGGAVKIDNSIALKVSDNGRMEDLHLRGTVKDKYNGYIWQKTDASTLKHKIKDTLDVGSYNIPYLYHDITIVPVKTETTTVFNPLYPYTVENKWEYYFADSDTEMYHPAIAREGKPYKISYKEYDVKSYNLSVETDGKNDPSLNKYLQISNSIPKRVYDLTDKIVSKYKGNPYLTVSAIEKYLKENYPYDLNTSNLPQGKDFVDYFLFDEKKGSCTYYATAMAVMCRLEGIPTRYVEGYDVPNTLPKDGFVEVSNANAHAWVEVYFKNAGWIVFDPTPGHYSAAEEAKVIEVPNTTGDNVNLPDTNKDNNKDKNQNDQQNDQQDNEQAAANQANIKLIMYILIPFILIIILVGLRYLLNYIFMKEKRFVSYSLYKIMVFGKLMKIPYNRGTTVREYMEKLSRMTDSSLERYIVLYEEMLYSNKKLSSLEHRTVHSALKGVRKKTVESTGRFRVFVSDFTSTFTYLFRMHKM